ncbi:hypothetical protein DL546_000376 [Coniochaeta pulveracea]|uniref:Uncharacterized protein n=1 Tax=Coniochaeta pulveracea TaxID=177199 RepID=A0A420Y7C1_9PEZI|nr:hypothetical protein DL546_000376 [Coniochaeta pulveracea]
MAGRGKVNSKSELGPVPEEGPKPTVSKIKSSTKLLTDMTEWFEKEGLIVVPAAVRRLFAASIDRTTRTLEALLPGVELSEVQLPDLDRLLDNKQNTILGIHIGKLPANEPWARNLSALLPGRAASLPQWRDGTRLSRAAATAYKDQCGRRLSPLPPGHHVRDLWAAPSSHRTDLVSADCVFYMNSKYTTTENGGLSSSRKITSLWSLSSDLFIPCP